MVLNSERFEGNGKPNAMLNEMREKRPITSKTSLRSRKSDDDGTNSKRPKSSSACEGQKLKPNLRIRSKTEEGTDSPEKPKNRIPKLDTYKATKKADTKKKSDTSLKKKVEDEECNKNVKISGLHKNDGSPKSEIDTNKDPKTHQKSRVMKIPRLAELAKDKSLQNSGTQRPRTALTGKKPSEIPKLKPLTKPETLTEHVSKPATESSKLPVKTETKEPEEKPTERSPGPSKKNLDNTKFPYKSYKEKKVKDALQDDFIALAPLYESELQKITQVWVNTIYCSLTMRANLVKLLLQMYPNVEREQFLMEDEKLMNCFSSTKTQTQLECDNVVNFVQSLIANRQAVKDQYLEVIENEETAEQYNYEWRKLNRKINEFTEKAKQLQTEIPELQKSKGAHDLAQREKIQNKENHLAEKDEEMKHLINQLNNLRQKESAFKGNVLLKVQDYKEIRADVISLKAMEKEYQELKAKFIDQNESYEKKIKNLELLLEEKKRILEKEREVKQQLQGFLNNVHGEQTKLKLTVSKELIQYVMGKSKQNRDKRREKLWIAAVKLVLRGFMIQMNKLERDRNKMLLELQSNDSENFTTVATSLVKKDYFIKSLKHQMNDIQKACKY